VHACFGLASDHCALTGSLGMALERGSTWEKLTWPTLSTNRRRIASLVQTLAHWLEATIATEAFWSIRVRLEMSGRAP